MAGSKWVSDSGTFEHIPSEEEKDKLLRTAMSAAGRLVYKRDTLECFCFHCQKYFTVEKKIFKQARYTRVCPNCYQPVSYHVTQEWAERRWIALCGLWGYAVRYSWKWGEEPKAGYRQVMYYNPKDGLYYRKGIAIGMGYVLCETDRTEWRPIKADRYGYMPEYNYFFMDVGIPDEMSRKAYYEHIGIELKSDQTKIASQNIFSRNQLAYIKSFDLHSLEDVEKYRKYMNENSAPTDLGLNVYYLDYLSRNKIRLSDFMDYMKDCRKIGVKVDKPRDFQRRHIEYSKIVAEMDERETDEKIVKRLESLQGFVYEDGDFTITPIGSCRELTATAKHLHNCMRSYAKRYGDGQTDLFVLRKNGEDRIAIEVKDKELAQARADHNGQCPKNLKAIIKGWCKKNQFRVKGEYVW